MNCDLIEAYACGAQGPTEAIAGLSPQQLNACPVPGTWSIQQIVLHLMDSDLIASDRMKRVIAEEEPQLIGYDETAFGRNLHYEKLDAQAACQVFALNRQLTAVILRNLPDEAFKLRGDSQRIGAPDAWAARADVCESLGAPPEVHPAETADGGEELVVSCEW